MPEASPPDYDEERKPSILAVDDMPSILQLLQMTLAPDYEVSTAQSGEEALQAVAARNFDLILLDVMMPGMDGLETLRRLRQLPTFATTPVIFLTAVDDLLSEQKALELGADDYIVKPFKPSLVQLRIANLLNRSQLQQELQLALSSADQGLWEWDLKKNRVRIDARHSVQIQLERAASIGEASGWDGFAHPESLADIAQTRQAYLTGQLAAFDVDARLRKQNGEWIWVNIYGKASKHSADGQIARLKGTYRNIEQRKAAENALRESEERLRFVMDATGEGIWDWAIPSDEIRHNSSWYRLLGQEESALPHSIELYNTLIHPDDKARVDNALRDCLSGGADFVCEYRLRHAQGHYLWLLGRGKVVERAPDGSPLRMVGANKNITERKNAEAEFKRMALFDPLTGLPNRRLLVDRLQQAISKNRRSAQYGAVLFIDMDRFKQLNDSLGHDFGDLLLIEIGRRLLACIRETDTAARLGGDEFIVMLSELGEDSGEALESAQKIASKILESLNQPYQLGPLPYRSTPSIGLTLFADEESGVDAIIKRADQAMYEAKNAGRNCLRVSAPDGARRKSG